MEVLSESGSPLKVSEIASRVVIAGYETDLPMNEIVQRVSLQVEARVGYGNEEGASSLERTFGTALAFADFAGFTAEVGYRYGETGRVNSPGSSGRTGYSVHTGTLTLRYRFGSI